MDLKRIIAQNVHQEDIWKMDNVKYVKVLVPLVIIIIIAILVKNNIFSIKISV